MQKAFTSLKQSFFVDSKVIVGSFTLGVVKISFFSDINFPEDKML